MLQGVALKLLLISSILLKGASLTPMMEMFDAMQKLMEGDGEFDRQFYDKLLNCMSVDSELSSSQDQAWQGMIDCWKGDCAPTDPWGETNSDYRELNITESDIDGMKIYEPCNYASNVAYYHTLTEICSKQADRPFLVSEKYYAAFVQSFSMMAVTSAFRHGSHTEVGKFLDDAGMSVVSYAMHQASLSALDNPSNILFHLQETPREKTSVELAQEFTDMFQNVPVSGWTNFTNDLDIPGYYLTVSGLLSTILTVAEDDPDKVNNTIHGIGELFHIDDTITSFINDAYLPEIRKATEHLDMPAIEKVKYIGNAMGTISKLFFASLWQEQILDISKEYFICPLINGIGWKKFAKFNTKFTQLNTFRYYKSDFIHGEDIYPGDWWCNAIYPHAKWHLETAFGMLDLAYLSDETYRILKTYNSKI